MPLPTDPRLQTGILAAVLLLTASCREKEARPAASSPAPPATESTKPPTTPPAPEPAPRLKLATVNIQQVFKEFHRTVALQKEQQADVVRVQKDSEDRLTRIRELETGITAIDKQLADPAISDMKKRDLAKEREDKAQDGIALDRERREFLQLRQAAMQEKYTERARALLEEIRRHVSDKAKAEGLDYVFDTSASGPFQTSIFVHTPDAADMTGEIIAGLNRDAPPRQEAGSQTDTR